MKRRRGRKGRQESQNRRPENRSETEAALDSICDQIKSIQSRVLKVSFTTLAASLGTYPGEVRKLANSMAPGASEVPIATWLGIWQQLGMLDAFGEGVEQGLRECAKNSRWPPPERAISGMPAIGDEADRVQVAAVYLRQAIVTALRMKYGRIPHAGEIAKMLGVDPDKVRSSTGSSGGEDGGNTDIKTSLMLWALSGVLPHIAEKLEARTQHILDHGYPNDDELGEELREAVEQVKEATLENQPKHARKLSLG